jgi:hypothetical protein
MGFPFVRSTIPSFYRITTNLPGKSILPSVVPGTYYLVDDPDNAILSEEQFEKVEETLLKVLQQPSLYKDMWDNVYQQLPEDIQTSYRPTNIARAYKHYISTHPVPRPPHWHKNYEKVVLKANPNLKWVSQSDLDREVCPGGRARVDVYWRCPDQVYPDDNTINNTICYTFDCFRRTVTVRSVHGYAGFTIARQEYQPDQLSNSVQSEEEASFSELLMCLRNLGPGDAECTLLDTTTTSVVEDPVGSSHEIVVFLPRSWRPASHCLFSSETKEVVHNFLLVNQRLDTCQLPSTVAQRILEFAIPDDDFVPVLRLHQRCILGPQFEPAVTRKIDTEIPPTAQQQRVLAQIRVFIGMGSVNSWTGEAEPCRARGDRWRRDLGRDTTCKESFRYTDDPDSRSMLNTLHPLYFDFPARDPTNLELSGARADWAN